MPVFSNAVLHWIKRADVMLAGVYRSLKPGGRFVAECGGHGGVHRIRTALVQALDRRGLDGEARVPWYFPTPGDYATRLERAGFRVDSIALIPRPTPLPGDIIGWLELLLSIFFKASLTKLAATTGGGSDCVGTTTSRCRCNLGSRLCTTAIRGNQSSRLIRCGTRLLAPSNGEGQTNRLTPEWSVNLTSSRLWKGCP